MCFLGEPFQHDLFVSYSHGDFAGERDSDLKNWSQAFASELEGELGAPRVRQSSDLSRPERTGRQSVDPGPPTCRASPGKRARVGLLIVLMSPHYLRSKWCGRERDWWRQTKHGLVGTGGRIFTCRVRPIDETPGLLTSRPPSALMATTGQASGQGAPVPLEWRNSDLDAPRSRSSVSWTCSTLRAIEAGSRKRRATPRTNA